MTIFSVLPGHPLSDVLKRQSCHRLMNCTSVASPDWLFHLLKYDGLLVGVEELGVEIEHTP